jgi:copper chaperone
LTETTLKIDGMSCNHCVARVENALKSVEGVESAKVRLENKEALIKYDPSKADNEKLKDAVKEVGYSAELAVKH